MQCLTYMRRRRGGGRRRAALGRAGPDGVAGTARSAPVMPPSIVLDSTAAGAAGFGVTSGRSAGAAVIRPPAPAAARAASRCFHITSRTLALKMDEYVPLMI